MKFDSPLLTSRKPDGWMITAQRCEICTARPGFGTGIGATADFGREGDDGSERSDEEDYTMQHG
jgi:hypothetical protein